MSPTTLSLQCVSMRDEIQSCAHVFGGLTMLLREPLPQILHPGYYLAFGPQPQSWLAVLRAQAFFWPSKARQVMHASWKHRHSLALEPGAQPWLLRVQQKLFFPRFVTPAKSLLDPISSCCIRQGADTWVFCLVVLPGHPAGQSSMPD